MGKSVTFLYLFLLVFFILNTCIFYDFFKIIFIKKIYFYFVFYEVSMVYKFVNITQVVPVAPCYAFGVVSFF